MVHLQLICVTFVSRMLQTWEAQDVFTRRAIPETMCLRGLHPNACSTALTRVYLYIYIYI